MEKLTGEEILHLIHEGENETFELKRENESQADLSELLVAFANTKGGIVLIGVADTGEITGISNLSKIRSRLEAAARNAKPSLVNDLIVYPVSLKERQILVGHLLPTMDAVYSTGGVFRYRKGASNNILTGEALTELVLRRRGREFDQHHLEEATLADLDEMAVNKFLQQRIALGSTAGELSVAVAPQLPSTAALDMLVAMKVLKRVGSDYKPTVAGYLMFAWAPQQLFPHAVVQCARFRGTTAAEFLDRQEIRGTIEQQLRAILLFIARNTSLASRITGLEREDVPAYPPVALREVIVNALMHRDYTRQAKMSINIFDDHLEILSPGGLLPGLKADHLEGIHELRNVTIGQLMLWTRLAESYGTGIRRMKEEMEIAQLPEPVFEDLEVWFRAILYGHGSMREKVQPNAIAELGLNDRQRDLLKNIRVGETINRTVYAEKYTISLPQASRDLGGLVDRGLLMRVGNARDTVYILSSTAAG